MYRTECSQCFLTTSNRGVVTFGGRIKGFLTVHRRFPPRGRSAVNTKALKPAFAALLILFAVLFLSLDTYTCVKKSNRKMLIFYG